MVEKFANPIIDNFFDSQHVNIPEAMILIAFTKDNGSLCQSISENLRPGNWTFQHLGSSARPRSRSSFEWTTVERA